MALSPNAVRLLDAFDTALSTSPEPSYKHPRHFPTLISLLMRLLQDGDELFPQDVRAWAVARGWSAQDGRDLGEAVIVVGLVLDKLELMP
jgi:hypothetical protein